MSPIVRKLMRLAPDFGGKGRLRFLGAFRRRGSRKWDVFVSIAGLHPDEMPAWKYLSELLGRALTPTEVARDIGTAMVLEEDDPRLAGIERQAESGTEPLRGVAFGDVELAEAYVLVSNGGVVAGRP